MPELMHARNDLVTVFGHELRSHVAPIKNAAELLRRAALNPATAGRIAGIIERQADGMIRLLDQLLASADSPSLQMVLRRSTTTVETIIKRGVEMVEPMVSARCQTLSIRLPGETIYIEADALWLTLAVQNVIGNAAKYTDPGGAIAVEVRRDGSSVEISIRDTGIGLAATELETVFDLYAQVAQPETRPAAGGLGVGLHLAKIVVDAHGGSIRAVSDGLGCGSTFLMRLPCLCR